MIDIRLVFTYDAKPLAETLTRLLEAEQHRVRLTFGRQSLAELEEAREERDAVVLIWSPDARSQIYMIEWANKIDRTRLVELARTGDVPRTNRKAPVIDFTQWRGERGGRAWDALSARLHSIDTTLNPPKPVSKPAIAAMLMIAVAAMFGAVSERNRTAHRVDTAEEPAPVETATVVTEGLERGGPIVAIEPASLDETLHFRRIPAAPLIDVTETDPLTAVDPIDIDPIRGETLLERLNDFNPLRQRTPAPNPDQNP
jgi:hypothetical protein